MSRATDTTGSSAEGRRETAFTMIELVVGMMLSLIVVALLVTALVKVFGSSERSGQAVKAQRAANLAFEQLTSDLRSARAPDREPQQYGSPDRLRLMIHDPTLARNRSGTRLELSDLVVAQPNRIKFYAEVVRENPDPECVEWTVAGDGSMQRIVRAGTPACANPGRELQRSTVMPPISTRLAGAAVPKPFSYRMLTNPTWRPTGDIRSFKCVTSNPDPASVATLKGMNFVTAVNLDLRSFVARNEARGDQQLSGTVAIVSRGAYEYRYALGCAA